MNILATILYGIAIASLVITGALVVWYLIQAERDDGAGGYNAKKIHQEKPFIVLVCCAVAAPAFGGLGGIVVWLA